jgi:hypothetical protein
MLTAEQQRRGKADAWHVLAWLSLGPEAAQSVARSGQNSFRVNNSNEKLLAKA